MKEDPMFIPLMFMLAYHYRADPTGVWQASLRSLETVVRRTGKLRRQIGEVKPSALWPHDTRAQDERSQNH
jgi:hypothetical protein